MPQFHHHPIGLYLSDETLSAYVMRVGKPKPTSHQDKRQIQIRLDQMQMQIINVFLFPDLVITRKPPYEP